jgi:hypothetical protein
MQLGDQHPFRFLIHDRDTKFSHAFDQVFRIGGIEVIPTPIRPSADARFVREPAHTPEQSGTVSTGLDRCVGVADNGIKGRASPVHHDHSIWRCVAAAPSEAGPRG